MHHGQPIGQVPASLGSVQTAPSGVAPCKSQQSWFALQHWPPQQLVPPSQLVEHGGVLQVPWQYCPLPHRAPQVPQFIGSLARLTH